MIPGTKLPQFVIIGKLQRNYILTADGTATIDGPGGSLLYAAVGASLWYQGIGLVGRVGEEYPQIWLEKMRNYGLDTRGIQIAPQSIDLRYFASHPDPLTSIVTNPVAEFARLGLSFPKSLLGYNSKADPVDSKVEPSEYSIRANQFPEEFLDVRAVHFAPIDYLSHSLIPSIFRQHHVNTISLDPGESYMFPTFWEEMPGLLRGVNIFHCNEKKIRLLFKGRTDDIWEMVDHISSLGVEVVVIKRADKGQWVIDAHRHRKWEIPAYPAKVVSLTGAGDAFCGGFLGSYKESYDPLEAALHGNISASFAVESTDPFYMLDTLPQLINLRLDYMRGLVRPL